MDDVNKNIQGESGNKVDLPTGATTNQNASQIYNVGTINNAVFTTDTVIKTYNLYLCRKLTEALSEYKPKVKEFLGKMKQTGKTDWEKDQRFTKIAFENIISSFGLLGILLRKVIGGGNDAAKSHNYANDYIEICVVTAQRALQLLSYSFISKLWDYKKDKKFEFSGNQSVILANYFSSYVELDFSEYLELLSTLVNIFDEQKIEYPFKEFNKDWLKGDGNFVKSYKNLNELIKPNSGQGKSSGAEEAEKELTEILCTLVFLANYKVVAVREISYEALKNKGAQYLHSYNYLEENSESEDKNKPYKAKYKYDLLPVSSDAILIFSNQQKYQEGLNLFPFIIDINALTGHSLARICFFTLFNEEDGKLIYSNFDIPSDKNEGTGDNSEATQVIIKFNDEVENALKVNSENDINDITSIKEDVDRYKKLQFNSVYNIFQNAKKEILE